MEYAGTDAGTDGRGRCATCQGKIWDDNTIYGCRQCGWIRDIFA